MRSCFELTYMHIKETVIGVCVCVCVCVCLCMWLFVMPFFLGKVHLERYPVLSSLNSDFLFACVSVNSYSAEFFATTEDKSTVAS